MWQRRLKFGPAPLASCHEAGKVPSALTGLEREERLFYCLINHFVPDQPLGSGDTSVATA